jgi:two-component system NtrC family sensor kinase
LNNRFKSGIEVIKNYGYLPPVSCYSGQLSQVFMNIISNAIDALTDKLGEQAASSKTWQPQIEISTKIVEHSDADWVSVRIADNGPGMPPAIQARIFETFFTTKPVGKGTGLGLAISHQIVTQKHGGQLLMRSQPGSGNRISNSAAAGLANKANHLPELCFGLCINFYSNRSLSCLLGKLFDFATGSGTNKKGYFL